MLYRKLRVRKIDGGYRIKFCDNPFNDIYLMEFELSNCNLTEALKRRWNVYAEMVETTNHRGSNLQGKYDRHHRSTYTHKRGCTRVCLDLLSNREPPDEKLQKIYGVKF